MLPVDWLRRFRGGLARERLLAPLTTWRIGGPAELFLEPADIEELVETVQELRHVGLPFRILGGGSNLLVADRGVRGVVISLARLNKVFVHDGMLLAEGGAKLHWVVRFAAAACMTGAESLAGIPGRLGGAVCGNAGGKYGDIGGLVCGLDLLDRDGHLEHVLPGPRFFGYRASHVDGRIVVRAWLRLLRAEPSQVRRRNLEVVRERRSTQPGWVGNAGCVFRNPGGASAGRLIDESGCKGLCVGPIHVSERHANFFENAGTGTAAEVRCLIDRVRERVLASHGIELETEVRQWD